MFIYIYFAKEVKFSPMSLLCNVWLFSWWLVCQQDYTKAKELTDLSLGSEKTTLTFGVDLDKGEDPGSFLTFLNIVR